MWLVFVSILIITTFYRLTLGNPCHRVGMELKLTGPDQTFRYLSDYAVLKNPQITQGCKLEYLMPFAFSFTIIVKKVYCLMNAIPHPQTTCHSEKSSPFAFLVPGVPVA